MMHRFLDELNGEEFAYLVGQPNSVARMKTTLKTAICTKA